MRKAASGQLREAAIGKLETAGVVVSTAKRQHGGCLKKLPARGLR
jgi:hypothetical protein